MKRFIGLVVAFVVTTTIQAQENLVRNRTGSWTVQVAGLVNGFSSAKSDLYDGTGKASPELYVSVMKNVTPWARVGLGVDYLYLREENEGIVSNVKTTEGFLIGGYPGTLTTHADRIQNKNRANVVALEVAGDFNFLEFWWPQRKLQKLNAYAGLSLGVMTGKNKNLQTTSYQEEAVAQGEDHFMTHAHSYIKSEIQSDHMTNFISSFRLSAEYDITPMFSVGALIQFHYPVYLESAPSSVYGFGLSARINI